MKNVPIVVGFSVITATQFGLGIWMLVAAALKGGKVPFGIRRPTLIRGDHPPCCGGVNVAEMIPLIPLDAYHLCIFVRHRKLEIGFTSISLLYGVSRLS